MKRRNVLLSVGASLPFLSGCIDFTSEVEDHDPFISQRTSGTYRFTTTHKAGALNYFNELEGVVTDEVVYINSKTEEVELYFSDGNLYEIVEDDIVEIGGSQSFQSYLYKPKIFSELEAMPLEITDFTESGEQIIFSYKIDLSQPFHPVPSVFEDVNTSNIVDISGNLTIESSYVVEQETTFISENEDMRTDTVVKTTFDWDDHTIPVDVDP